MILKRLQSSYLSYTRVFEDDAFIAEIKDVLPEMVTRITEVFAIAIEGKNRDTGRISRPGQIRGEMWQQALICYKKLEKQLSRFMHVFQYPPDIRRIIYTTNLIESFNKKIRIFTKTKSSFSTGDSLFRIGA